MAPTNRIPANLKIVFYSFFAFKSGLFHKKNMRWIAV